MNDQDIEKLITRIKEVFPTKEEFTELREDFTTIETKLDEVTDTLNAHTLKLDNLASKHDLETMLEKSLSLAVLKAEHDHMKKVIREKLHVEI